MSYSSIPQEQIRRATQIADKVLKGAKPADIPVEQPTNFELLLNLKTAKALGIAIPASAIVRLPSPPPSRLTPGAEYVR